MKNYLNLISKKKNQVTMIVKTVDVSLMKSTMSIRFVITVDSILKKVNSPSAVAAIKNLLHTLHYEMRPTACINNLLAAGFCERWPKACVMGLRWLRPAAFDYGKKLAANNGISGM